GGIRHPLEASALTHASRRGLLAKPSRPLRLHKDDRLIAMMRDGHERAFEVIGELKEALRERFREQLCAASAEAEAIGDPAIVPLKDEARKACLNIANIAAERCFFADRVQLVATAKINGGAVFVGRNPLNARRIDVEIEPGGSSAEFVATQRAETVSEFSYDLDEDVFRAWLDWLLRPS
ncbi:MAG: hypothetical protein ACRD1T_23620, partial [Acidimicrobiia bacterium]